jgi:post-segregation antitoxin (ccd killing protein)
VLHENTGIAMNVTLKLPDDLVREARHRAVNQSKSLSAWMAALVRRELAATPAKGGEEPQSWMEALRLPDAPDWFYEKDFPLPDRKETKHRDFNFEPDED